MSEKKKTLLNDQQRQQILDGLTSADAFVTQQATNIKKQISDLELPEKVADWTEQERAKFDAELAKLEKNETVQQILNGVGAVSVFANGVLSAAGDAVSAAWQNENTQQGVRAVREGAEVAGRRISNGAKRLFKNMGL